ncbi:MAG: prepilin peptidase [Eubacterium sp.]|nr:prepilin peptidase [Eubacterium sp.]
MELTLGLKLYFYILSFIFGTIFGSFINCMAWRITVGESVVKGRSRCPHCGHVLSAADLVPIFSWLLLKGRCRYCKNPISIRYLLIELITGIAFLLAAVRFGLSFETLRAMILVCILMGLSLVDYDSQIIPNGFLLFGIAVWAFFLPLVSEKIAGDLISGLAGGFAIGGGMLLISMIFDKVTGKESLGGGDVKLFFMTGLYLGPAVGLFNLILACIIGLLFAVLLRRQKFPFGPAISIASYVSLLYGSMFVEWYSRLIG